MFEKNRQDTREVFFEAWQHHKQNKILEAMQQLIVDVILLHPEYHPILDDPDNNMDKDYTVEMGQSNPFLHMGLHIAIREQLQIDQPPGIKARVQQLLIKHQDPHTVEHMVMECLAQSLWEAQSRGQMPDNQSYLVCLDKLL